VTPTLDLRDSVANLGCSKPGCATGSRRFHRHHRANERFFLRQAQPQHGGKAWYKAMQARYDEFREDDIVLLCDWHHEEVHQLYYKRLDRWLSRHGEMFWKWSRPQILEAMNDLRQLCRNWERKPTPGCKPGTFVGRTA